MKVNIIIIIIILSLPAGTCYTNVEGFFLFLGNYGHFSEKSFVYVKSHFLGRKNCKIFLMEISKMSTTLQLFWRKRKKLGIIKLQL